MKFDERLTTVAVFSHPNHELAIYGTIQRIRPWLVFLTDGGGENRVAETRRGLGRLSLLERTHFLNFTEQSFYDALLDRSTRFYEEVASRLRTLLDEIRPAQLLCDAVEWYNPVHDMSLPIVVNALRGTADVAVFEVPLVYQRSGTADHYQIQRPTPSRLATATDIALSSAEVDAKINARDEIYTILTAQLGEVITSIPRAELASETLVPAEHTIRRPTDAQLRYERRAQILYDRGEIRRRILFAEHYVPVAEALVSFSTSA